MSYIRLTTFTTQQPKTREEIQLLVDELNQKANESADFEGIQYFADFNDGKYGAISYYKTQEARESIGKSFTDIVRAHVGNVLKGNPTIQHFEEFP